MPFKTITPIATLLLLNGCQGDTEGTNETGDSNISDTASAVAIHTVLAEASDGGSISPAGEIEVDVGQTVTFELTPNEGHALASVSENCGGTLKGFQFTTEPIEDDCRVIALFAEEAPPEPAAYCSGTPAELLDVVVCDPDQTLDDWSQGRSYWTTDLRIPSGAILSLPFTSNAIGQAGFVEITNNMPGLNASGMFWHGWFSAIPGGDLVEDHSYCRSFSSNPNPDQLQWNQTESEEWKCHLGTTEQTLYFNMEVRCFEKLSSLCTPGERYPDDYYVGVWAMPTD